MKTLIASTFLLLCAGALRAECVTTVSTVTVNIALSTSIATSFKITTVCTETNERIIDMDQYVRELKQSKEVTESDIVSATDRANKFEEKIVEAETIKRAVKGK